MGSYRDIANNLTVYGEAKIGRKSAYMVEEDFETANKIANKYGYEAVKTRSQYAPEISRTYVMRKSNSTGHLKDL